MIDKLIKLSFLLNNVNTKKEYYKLSSIVKEAASKFNALKKMGFSDKLAKEINDICRGYSIWIANAIINESMDLGKTREEAVALIERPNHFNNMYKEDLRMIMDWVHMGLEGDYKEYRNSSYLELIQLSRDWHDSLTESGAEIGYNEINPILIDFRDKDGIGYYWADLGGNYCSEESRRMGHCGRSSSGSKLYSLRKTYKQNQRTLLNKSVLTAAISSDGIITQLKGAKNSKPKEEYHKYIVELLTHMNTEEDGGGPFIKGFLSEYEASTDFQLSDLNNDDLKKVIEKNPELLNDIGTKIILSLKFKDKSYIEGLNLDNIRVKIDEAIITAIFGDNRSSRDYLSSSQIHDILLGDTENIFGNIYENLLSNDDFVDTYLNLIDNNNKNLIIKLIKEFLDKKNINLNINENNITNFISKLNKKRSFNYLEEEELESNSSVYNEVYDFFFDKILIPTSNAVNSSYRAEIEDRVYNYIVKNLSRVGKFENDNFPKIIVNFIKIVKDATYSSSMENVSTIFSRIKDDGYLNIEDIAYEFIVRLYDEDSEPYNETRIDLDHFYNITSLDKDHFNTLLKEYIEEAI